MAEVDGIRFRPLLVEPPALCRRRELYLLESQALPTDRSNENVYLKIIHQRIGRGRANTTDAAGRPPTSVQAPSQCPCECERSHRAMLSWQLRSNCDMPPGGVAASVPSELSAPGTRLSWVNLTTSRHKCPPPDCSTAAGACGFYELPLSNDRSVCASTPTSWPMYSALPGLAICSPARTRKDLLPKPRVRAKSHIPLTVAACRTPRTGRAYTVNLAALWVALSS